MDTIYNGKFWRASTTMSDRNSFFHSAFGVKTGIDEMYLDKRAKSRRMHWGALLTYFEDEEMPSRLADILKKCLSGYHKNSHAPVDNQSQFDDYVSDIVKGVRQVGMEEIPILASLENVKIVLLLGREPDQVIVINPDASILGSYPTREKSKEEVVLCLEEGVFSRMDSVDEDFVPKLAVDKKTDVKEAKDNVGCSGSSLIKYKKGGSAGSEGVQYQVGLLTVFFLNALQKLSGDWKLSTENEEAGKFDDVVLEWSKKDTLLQAKHKQSKTKKITFKDLLSTNSKTDDFSLPKYFLSYEEIKGKFKLEEIIICTNASVDGKTMKYLKHHEISPESMLYFESCDYKFYTFSDEIVPDLLENVKSYFEKNYQNKGVQATAITDENIRHFLGHLQFYINYPPGNDIGKVTEQMLSNMKRLKILHDPISPLEMHTKILDWFQLKQGIYLNDIYAKSIFSEIWSDNHWQRLGKYNLLFQGNNLDFQTSKRIFYVMVEGGYLLQEIKIFHTLQSDKSKILFIHHEDGSEKQKQVIEAFNLPQYTTLVIVWPKITNELVAREVGSKLRDILSKYNYKKIVLVAECNHKLPQHIGLSNDEYEVINQPVTFGELSTDSQERLLKKKNIEFQGKDVSLEKLFATQLTKVYGLNSDALEELIKDKRIKVGKPFIEFDEDMQFYIKRKLKRKIKETETEGQVSVSDEIIPEELIYNVDDKVVLISDGAGTGKSTVLTSLAVTIKEKHPHLWVVRVNLNDYTRILKDFLRRNNEIINIEELLNSKTSTKLINHLERFAFFTHKKIVLMFDGFDEISPVYDKLILNLISRCKEEPNFVKVFVTTRPQQLTPELSSKLSVRPFELEPFTEENQIDFLVDYWLHNLKEDDTKKDKCKRYANALISKMSLWINLHQQGKNHFAAIPLQIRMLAEIFQQGKGLERSEDWESCGDYIQYADDAEPNLPQKMDISKLYKLFIEKKWAMFVDKGNQVGNTTANQALIDQFDEYHAYQTHLALESILNKETCKLFTYYQEARKNVEVNALKIGIVQKVDNKFQFMHRTFAEYLVAESLIEELLVPNKNIEFQKLLIEEIFLDVKFNVICVFFNSFLQQILDKLPPTIFQEYQSISYQISSSNIPKFDLLHHLTEQGHLAILKLIFKCMNPSIVTKVPNISFTDNNVFTVEEETYGNVLKRDWMLKIY